jgi:hypothetical protein
VTKLDAKATGAAANTAVAARVLRVEVKFIATPKPN